MADGLGSSLSLTDAAGAVQTEYAYGSFGQAATTGASSNNSNQYTGRENDGTELQYNRARYYSPTLQRFISEDPLGFGGGDINVYAYTANSPTNFTDPSGLSSSGIGVSTALGAWLAARKPSGDWWLGFAANASAGFGDGIGAMCMPPWAQLIAPGWNPVKALRDLTPGGAAVDPSSGAYLIGEGGAIVWGVALGAAAGGAGGAGGKSGLPGLPSSAPKPSGLGSTGRTIPGNLSEQLGMEQAMSNPTAGTQVPLRQGMSDARWPGNKGWVKMSQNINGNEIHYVLNRLTGAVDDFKFK